MCGTVAAPKPAAERVADPGSAYAASVISTWPHRAGVTVLDGGGDGALGAGPLREVAGHEPTAAGKRAVSAIFGQAGRPRGSLGSPGQ
jgi:hypothetical protein